ncbi:MAG: helix-turn-helix transcriptional regulator [Ruminococcaceae bacterium]|nr:helix-turn-helix transcriptional regulator [Oscillospiraceae bacterium]
MKHYNDRIRDLREARRLTQKQVAEMLGIRQQVYSKYELGVRSLPIEHLMKLCRFYEISSDWVLGLVADDSEQEADN